MEQAIAELKQLLGARANDTAAVRDHHSHGESYHAPAPPDVVCFPRTTDEVAEIVRISARFKVPVVPFGAGTSLEGHVNAIRGGITIDLREMNKVVRVSAEDLDATVEAGVTRLQLNKALHNTGLTFPIDPGADATIGGMAATRASGTTAVRYGTMRENVLGLTVVLADGTVIRTGTRARKSSAGYDLTRLFVGSEGHARRDHRGHAATAPAARSGVGGGLLVRLDSGRGRNGDRDHSARRAGGADRAARRDAARCGEPLLEDELPGCADAVLRIPQRQRARTSPTRRKRCRRWPPSGAAARSSGRPSLEDRERLWQARHDALYAALALRPGARAWTTDVCVPISRLAECVVETKKDNAGAPFPICLVGHAGDGNFHLHLRARPGKRRRARGGAPPQRAHGAAGAGDGRHLQRRTRRRLRQDEVSRGRARPRARGHARRSNARSIPTTG